jgi:hypothetical protein
LLCSLLGLMWSQSNESKDANGRGGNMRSGKWGRRGQTEVRTPEPMEMGPYDFERGVEL